MKFIKRDFGELNKIKYEMITSVRLKKIGVFTIAEL